MAAPSRILRSSGISGHADGERGTATVVDELAHVHAPGVADGERSAATTAVLVVKLSRDCN